MTMETCRDVQCSLTHVRNGDTFNGGLIRLRAVPADVYDLSQAKASHACLRLVQIARRRHGLS